MRNFLNGEWRRGRLDGATAEDAFHVICNDSTNPNYEIDNGRLICEIGLRPPLPSEFVIVRLGRRVGETGVVELGGAAHA